MYKYKRLILAALFVTVALSRVSPVCAESLDELLVEKGVITKAEAGTLSGSPEPSKLYWNQGAKLDFPDADFTAKLNTLIQPRYTFSDGDEDRGGKNISSFNVQRAQIWLSGTALNDEFFYMLETNFAGKDDLGSGQEVTPRLEDAFIEWRPCPNEYYLRMGQFKPAVSRQFNTSDYALMFPDRTVVSDSVALQREPGASFTYETSHNFATVSGAIFNGQSDGEGINRGGNDPDHVGVVSFRINPMGRMNVYEEGDVGFSEVAALSFGAAYSYGRAHNDRGAGLIDTEQQNLSYDGNFKLLGLGIHVEGFYDNFRPESDSTYSANPGFHYHGNGGYTEAGYFVAARRVELAGRYGILGCDHGAAPGICENNDYVQQMTAGVNYYFWRHNLKAQVAWEHFIEDGDAAHDDTVTNQYIVQLTGYF